MKDFASSISGSSALSEAADLVRSRRAWAAVLGVAVLLSIGGPFGTLDSLTFWPRLGYWSAVCLGSFTLGLMVSIVVADLGEARRLPPVVALLTGLACAALPVALWNSMLQWSVLGQSYWDAFFDLFFEVLIVSIIVGGLYELFTERQDEGAKVEPSDREVFLAKLPPEVGRDCLHIQAQDHYLRVTTTKGSALILMPLGKTVEALGDLGIRVHRSWWVARDHIRETRWKKGALFVVLSNGEAVPVGRSYRKSVLAALKA